MTLRETRPPKGLLCELLSEPAETKIRTPNPKFSWIIDDDATGTFQTAFRIMVASSRKLLLNDSPDLWDTGSWNPEDWTTDARTLHVEYDGAPLAENSTYHWKVKIRNNRGEESHWSEIQEFHTGEFTTKPPQPTRKVTITREKPGETIRKSPDRIFFDFSRVAFGTVEVRAEVENESEIELLLGEISNAPASIDENPGGTKRFKRLSMKLLPNRKLHKLIIPPDERNTKTTLDDGSHGAILMPEHIGEVAPFRYCEISGPALEKTDISVRRLAAHYPFDDDAAEFHSSSAILDDIWNLCHYSIKATSFLGIHVDGDRERIPYEADAYINQLGHYCCDREFAMPRATHEYLLTHPTWPTEWIMFSVMMAWIDYEHTGDSSFLEHRYDDLKAKTLAGLERGDGLLEIDPDLQTRDFLNSIHLPTALRLKNIVDWPECERDGCEVLPVNTVVNAFHARVLGIFADIANILNKHGDAEIFRAKSAKTREALLSSLMDESTGLFIDGEGSSHSSIHSNLFPLAFGLVPENLKPNLAAFIKKRGMACSVYGAQFLLEALYEAGDPETALALMTNLGERGWAHWIYDLDSTITLEAWDDRFKPNQDWNHAWGAAPVNIIPRYLMGVRPLSPGFEKFEISPAPASLEYARIAIPTIRGTVKAAFTNIPGTSFRLEVTIPPNSTAVISAPAGEVSNVVFDGRRVAAIRENGRLLVPDVPPGKHTLETTPPIQV